MKRIVMLLLVVMLVIPVMVSCKLEETHSDLGLFANNFVEYDGWIYYSEFKSGDLYKVKTNGEDRTRVGDIKTTYFKIYEDRIYYLDERKALYCAALDGSTIMLENEFIGGDKFYIVDGWVYSLARHMVIYKTKTDGTECTVLGKGNEPCGDFCIEGDWIYYTVWKPIDGWGYALFKMRTDGTQRTQIMQQSALAIDYDENWIYFVDTAGKGVGTRNTDGQSISKVRFDGSEKQKIIDSDMHHNSFFKVIGEWIYYENFGDDSGLYKVNTDSGKRVKITESYRVGEVGLWGNWMIYLCMDTELGETYLQMIRISDTEKTDKLIDKMLADMPEDVEVRKYE